MTEERPESERLSISRAAQWMPVVFDIEDEGQEPTAVTPSVELWYYTDQVSQEAGVERGWLVHWTGEPGPALRVEVSILHDGDGGSSTEMVGEWVDCEVVDDTTG
jgi:hypothetical protein